MTEISENDQARLRDLYLKQGGPQNMAATDSADDAVQSLVRRSNLQTGTRDLLTLGVTSLFALLLIFFAPLARLSGAALGKTSKVKARPKHRIDR
ncbi:MAG: hypothetical protein OEN02_05870 [Gammaproteobacteria bacterium]|nr:hypothetical protein [Gammaproteobacteria bacterium]MDH3536964.1 hypothetical protein [Gammaproteobacteria bacterium]